MLNEIEPPTQEELDQFEVECIAYAHKKMRQLEEQWAAAGQRFAWVDLEPTWVSALDWDVYVFRQAETPKQPSNRIYRFSLAGGGQIKVIEQYRRLHLWPGREPEVCHVSTELKIAAHTPDGLKKYAAQVDGICGEMMVQAAVSRTAPQDILDRAAATLRSLEDKAEHFYALLDGATGCAICGRPLRDEVSKLCAVGPDCARHHGIPHSTVAANQRLELRRRLLGCGG